VGERVGFSATNIPAWTPPRGQYGRLAGGNSRKLRAMFLRRHPLCADPFEMHGGRPVVATEVDHIQPLSRGGGHEWENLQALCKSCHSKKTARETGFTRG
jgi:5-methylcytosine-specific restriction endonuclease McrA